MKNATFAEYQEAKNEIIGGIEYKEETQFPNQWGMSSKQYNTAGNGTFYEVTDPNTGVVEFWSDKHSESRYYDGNKRAATQHRVVVHYTLKNGNEQYQLQRLAADVLNCGTRVTEARHVAQEFSPNGDQRTIETGFYCIEVLNELTGSR